MNSVRKRRRKFAAVTISIVAVALVVVALVRSYRGTEEKDDPMVSDLNAVLVNSEIPELEAMDRKIEAFLKSWRIHGASLAITRNDSLLYVKGYGYADSLEEVRPGTIFRLASVSKLITGAGIMVLCDRGLLDLSDPVFGSEGILGAEPYTEVIKDKRYYRITVEDLLRHTAGFTTRGGDPMFPDQDFLTRNHFSKVPEKEDLLRCVLKHRLRTEPGTHAEYSNLGFYLLSLIIEKVSGMPYQDWIQENVLRPCGCVDFHIGGNFLEDRLPGETHYYCHDKEKPAPCILDTSARVVRCYGGSDITGLSGAGAWVASAPELARFVCSIDRIPGMEEIISEEGILKMTETTDDKTFGIGWNDITEEGTWTRTGTLSSTSALIKVYPDGECWIMVTNTGTWKGPRFTKYISSLFRRSREEYSSLLPTVNLFTKKDAEMALNPLPDRP